MRGRHHHVQAQCLLPPAVGPDPAEWMMVRAGSGAPPVQAIGDAGQLYPSTGREQCA